MRLVLSLALAVFLLAPAAYTDDVGGQDVPSAQERGKPGKPEKPPKPDKPSKTKMLRAKLTPGAGAVEPDATGKARMQTFKRGVRFMATVDIPVPSIGLGWADLAAARAATVQLVLSRGQTRAYSAEGRTPEHRPREAQRAACRYSGCAARSRQPLEAASAESEGSFSPIIRRERVCVSWGGFFTTSLALFCGMTLLSSGGADAGE